MGNTCVTSIEDLQIEECLGLTFAEGLPPQTSSSPSLAYSKATTTKSDLEVDVYRSEAQKLHQEQYDKWYILKENQRKQQQQSLQRNLNPLLHTQQSPTSPSTLSSHNSPSSPFLKMYEKSMRGELGAVDNERFLK